MMSKQLERYVLSFFAKEGFIAGYLAFQPSMRDHLQEATGDSTLTMELRSSGAPNPWYLIVEFKASEKRELVADRLIALLTAVGLSGHMTETHFDAKLPEQYVTP